MYQSKLFENENTRHGIRKYGGSIHYHYVSDDANSTETKNGLRMVQSTMTEMLANVSRRSNISKPSDGAPACTRRLLTGHESRQASILKELACTEIECGCYSAAPQCSFSNKRQSAAHRRKRAYFCAKGRKNRVSKDGFCALPNRVRSNLSAFESSRVLFMLTSPGICSPEEHGERNRLGSSNV